MQKTIGGDRLGSGKKMKVDLHGYERSTHDLGYIWRSTMAAGTLVPFLNEVALPGDTFDINLECDIKTHPTIGPLFGSYKVQLDVFQAPIRLYHSALHNNKLGIGMAMQNVSLPVYNLKAYTTTIPDEGLDILQINPSCLLAYLGVRGIGLNGNVDMYERSFNAIPLIAYWDIYKNYYANKQEEIGVFIDTPLPERNITSITVDGNTIPLAPASGMTPPITVGDDIIVTFTGTAPDPETILFLTNGAYGWLNLTQVANNIVIGATTITADWTLSSTASIVQWNYALNEFQVPLLKTFALSHIDDMREAILQNNSTLTFVVNNELYSPYDDIVNGITEDTNRLLSSQQGLGIKTYQSDLFNNWLQTEWIDGTGGITELTAIDTSGGSFTIDTLNLSKKVYDMLNRIAISGGTYNDWLDAVYTHNRFTQVETPMYMGGLSKELIFQEVVSNSEATSEAGTQPLGTLAGKGILAKKHKGGHITIKVDEPSYIMGIISLTPRIDYSQGNKWDTGLRNMDNLHKPALDEIGFQELITEQMAWWSTFNTAGQWIQRSAGKQPAWINYMTNTNQVYGNFAIPTSEMFMTLNRRYEYDPLLNRIQDLTTYIDPVKYNHIFAQTSRDAQNFWAQIAVDITARRKMSAKIMPNL